MDQRFYEKLKTAEDGIEVLQQKRADLMSEKILLKPWLESIRKYANIQKLTREVLVMLVERVDVFEGHRIEVHFRNEDEIRDVLTMVEG